MCVCVCLCARARVWVGVRAGARACVHAISVLAREFTAPSSYLLETRSSKQNGGRMQSVPLINPPPGGQKTALGGFLTALDLEGNILWQTANPFPAVIPIIFNGSPLAALNVGPVTVANNVVYWPSYDIQGRLLFVDARNGQLLGSFATGQPFGSLEGGASVADGSVYVGAGFGVAIGLPGPSVVWGLTTPGVAP
jgi:hypothetical protein